LQCQSFILVYVHLYIVSLQETYMLLQYIISNLHICCFFSHCKENQDGYQSSVLRSDTYADRNEMYLD
jgi:hypothetical protein